MKGNKNLTQMNKDISSKILESIYLLNILDDLTDGDAKLSTIINIIIKYLRTSFYDIEKCRKMLSALD